MLCISKSQFVGFFIGENFKIEHLQDVLPNYKYNPHPDHPNMIMRYSVESKNDVTEGDFTVDYGDHWYRGYRKFRRFNWIPNTDKYVFIDLNYGIYLESLDAMKYDVTYEYVSDYKISGNHILVIQAMEATKYKLYIIDVGRKIYRPASFPTRLMIHDIKLFQYANGNYYIVLVHQDSKTCLWTTTATTFHFVNKMCFHNTTSASLESNFYLNKWVEGLIYTNLPLNATHLKTHRTTDDGRYWEIVKFKHLSLENDEPVEFNFELHDPNSVPRHFGFSDFQYERYGDALQPYMTIDGGNS
ncbi:hypothetical protein RF11_06928 [Thelohanellus kitauei]|uniref:Uncharacterized protein n=1 Tax=Thelohanellus kitauei TaxID=669202 RepID=A0A0C2MWE9_THEKT|nr:hypothetical protein RF11_06928 [Thelohanellus kitauei]